MVNVSYTWLDYGLRNSVEKLHTESEAAYRRASRISSQLSKVQGSLDARLNALTAAFDAYVELGDVREQLAGYAEPAVVRREVIDAIAALGDDSPVTTIDDRGTGYWIAAAMNAVIARSSGTTDPGEVDLVDRVPAAAWFIVAAVAVVGHGPQVAEEAAGLLQPVGGRLDDRQLALWRAVRADVFGPELWQRVVSGWSGDVAVGPGETDPGVLGAWWAWASAEAATERQDVLEWLETQPGTTTGEATEVEPAPTKDPGPAEDDVDQGPLSELEEILVDLINTGEGEERRLLARARELRATIETAGQPAASTRDRRSSGSPQNSAGAVAEGTSGEAEGHPVAEVVRQAYHESTPGSADRTLLFSLIAPSLAAAVEQHAPDYLDSAPATVKITIPGGPIEVAPNGPDSTGLARHTSARQGMRPNSTRPMMVAGGIAAAAVIVALTGLIAGAEVLSVVMLAVAVIAGLVTRKTWAAQRRSIRDWEERGRRWDAQLTEAAERARKLQQEQRELRQQRADQLDRIRQVLRTTA